eukprot:6177156-Pleurochrysis_carterae.AAC.1
MLPTRKCRPANTSAITSPNRRKHAREAQAPAQAYAQAQRTRACTCSSKAASTSARSLSGTRARANAHTQTPARKQNRVDARTHAHAHAPKRVRFKLACLSSQLRERTRALARQSVQHTLDVPYAAARVHDTQQRTARTRRSAHALSHKSVSCRCAR